MEAMQSNSGYFRIIHFEKNWYLQRASPASITWQNTVEYFDSSFARTQVME
uniref:Uncharacterized protein n=1 Tax=Oryza brachyantha TaxID=4533 RepID=J3MZB8_ORYBR